jgi:ribosome-associated protein
MGDDKKNSGTSDKRKKVDRLKDFIVESLKEDKAEDVKIISLDGKTDFAYYMIVATGRSSRHVISIADKLADKLIKEGVRGINIEGKAQGDWVLIDAFDIVIHVFRSEVREMYNIEKIWEFDILAP